jgi:phage gp46-like protein
MIRIVWNRLSQDGDIDVDENGMVESPGLETACILSLFCDAPVEEGDDVPDGIDRRGWWADAYTDESDTWGSKLWQVFSQKATTSALESARRAAERALAWLVEDNVARSVDVETFWIEGRRGYMGILVKVYKPNVTAPEYVGPWEVSWTNS